MGAELLNLVCESVSCIIGEDYLTCISLVEHTMLVTETGVEVLTARLETSPGGPVPMPSATNGSATTDGTVST